jgi:hypothetical protein
MVHELGLTMINEMVFVNYIASLTHTSWFVFVNHIVLPPQNKHVIVKM